MKTVAGGPIRLAFLGLVLLIALVLAVSQASSLLTPPARAQAAGDLFFSEYVEGTGNNKALEIYNGTGTAVDLGVGGYQVQVYVNGRTTAALTIPLAGVLPDGDVFVLAHAGARPEVLEQADQTSAASWFNGNDAVVLRRGGDVVDAIGQVGFDPGAAWGSGLTSTADRTLRRQPTVSHGRVDAYAPFDPAGEWDGFPADTFDGLGAHARVETAPAIVATRPASNAGGVSPGASLTVTFSEPVVLADGWLRVTCTASGEHWANVSGGPVSYTVDPTADFAPGERCTATIASAAVADRDEADPPDTLAADYAWSFGVSARCLAEVTPPWAIQGRGGTSPLAGRRVATQGVVTATFPGTRGLDGFFLQDSSGDGDPETSDGLFVYLPESNRLSSVEIQVGDLVGVSGTAREFNSQTQVDGVTELVTCGTGVVEPTVVSLPEATDGDLERVEGMLVTFPQTLTVSQNAFLGRLGQVTLAVDGRLFQPTSASPAGSPEAVAQADLNARRRLVLDDGSSRQNVRPVPYPGEDGALRAGDTVAGLTGVLDAGPVAPGGTSRDYRLHPARPPGLVRANPRPAAPPVVGGPLRVASLNLRNYFNGDGAGGGFPTERGAASLADFEHQRAKLVATLVGLDADVVGLMEVENDGVDATSAIQDLVGALNEATAPGAYAFVPEPAPGSDAIKVSLLYRPARVEPVGPAVSYQVDGGPYGPALFNRPPLAQTFRLVGDDAVFTVVVNHFKSRSDCPSESGSPDADRGEGCWNARRTTQAEALLPFVAQLQAESGDPDVLVLGDLNAYGAEQPLTTLLAGGLTDEVARFVPSPYSYVFDGQAGALDHALATSELSQQVAGAAEWHVNADEPPFVADQDPATPYRSSDHDPLLIGLSLW